MATEAELGWMAGIIDGEGCICGHWNNRGKYSTGGNVSIEVRVEACSIAMITKATSICKDLGVHFTVETRSNQKLATKPSYRINIRRRDDVLTFLKAILGCLVVKQSEAAVAIEFYERFGDQRGKKEAFRADGSEKIVLFQKLRDLKKVA
jgi:hypothetical protein